MKFTLGIKKNMGQIFDEDGKCYPVTLVSVGPITVIQVKTKEKDGYDAVQFGYGKKDLQRVGKPMAGKLAKALKDKAVGFKYIKEWRLKDGDPNTMELKVGDVLDASVLVEGEKVNVSATSKGKGFQGVIKRHGFKGQPRTHGQKHCERAPGSIGGGLRNKVPKGMRMAGRMGSDRITVKNLVVMKVNKEANEVLLRGAIPGNRGALVEIKN